MTFTYSSYFFSICQRRFFCLSCHRFSVVAQVVDTKSAFCRRLATPCRSAWLSRNAFFSAYRVRYILNRVSARQYTLLSFCWQIVCRKINFFPRTTFISSFSFPSFLPFLLDSFYHFHFGKFIHQMVISLPAFSSFTSASSSSLSLPTWIRFFMWTKILMPKLSFKDENFTGKAFAVWRHCSGDSITKNEPKWRHHFVNVLHFP